MVVRRGYHPRGGGAVELAPPRWWLHGHPRGGGSAELPPPGWWFGGTSTLGVAPGGTTARSGSSAEQPPSGWWFGETTTPGVVVRRNYQRRGGGSAEPPPLDTLEFCFRRASAAGESARRASAARAPPNLGKQAGAWAARQGARALRALGDTTPRRERGNAVRGVLFLLGRLGFLYFLAAPASKSGVAQWLACWAHNPKVRGSKSRSAKF